MGGARSSRRDFPSFWEGLSLRLQVIGLGNRFVIQHFPSFWEGLSLRQRESRQLPHWRALFPFLLGRAFIEAISKFPGGAYEAEFPFLLGRAFIEAAHLRRPAHRALHFPSFWEGLSLRHFGFGIFGAGVANFPSFWEGLSLRQ